MLDDAAAVVSQSVEKYFLRAKKSFRAADESLQRYFSRQHAANFKIFKSFATTGIVHC
jgi:hypothetical protein